MRDGRGLGSAGAAGERPEVRAGRAGTRKAVWEFTQEPGLREQTPRFPTACSQELPP